MYTVNRFLSCNSSKLLQKLAMKDEGLVLSESVAGLPKQINAQPERLATQTNATNYDCRNIRPLRSYCGQ